MLVCEKRKQFVLDLRGFLFSPYGSMATLSVDATFLNRTFQQSSAICSRMTINWLAGVCFPVCTVAHSRHRIIISGWRDSFFCNLIAYFSLNGRGPFKHREPADMNTNDMCSSLRYHLHRTQEIDSKCHHSTISCAV